MTGPEVLRLPVVVALICQLSSQAFKVVFYSIREHRLAMERFVHAGGIPSAHSAFVSALTAAVGFRHGVTGEIFAVSFVFSAIIVYDAFRLRGHVQRHAEVLNRLRVERDGAAGGADLRPSSVAAEPPASMEPLSENVGHTLPEVVAGVVFGVGMAALLTVGAA